MSPKREIIERTIPTPNARSVIYLYFFVRIIPTAPAINNKIIPNVITFTYPKFEIPKKATVLVWKMSENGYL